MAGFIPFEAENRGEFAEGGEPNEQGGVWWA